MPPLALAAGVLSFVLEQLRPQTREGQIGAQAAFALALWAYSGFWSARRAANAQSRLAQAQPAPVLPPEWTQTDWTALAGPRAGYSFLERGAVPAPRFTHPALLHIHTTAGAAGHDMALSRDQGRVTLSDDSNLPP